MGQGRDIRHERHDADVIVGEANYGGDMVRMVVHAARPRTPFKKVTASRRGRLFAPSRFLRCTSRGRSARRAVCRASRTNCQRSRPWISGRSPPEPEQTRQSGRCRTVPGVIKGAKLGRSPSNWSNSAIRSGAVLVQWDGWHEARPTLCWPGDMRGRNLQPRRPHLRDGLRGGFIPSRFLPSSEGRGYGRQRWMR